MNDQKTLTDTTPRATGLSAYALRVNGLHAPMGIDSEIRFSWLLRGEGYHRSQSAYRILVSSSLKKAECLCGDLWDSGKTEDDSNYDIAYRGKPLTSRSRYYFRVAVWDENGRAGDFGEIGVFETGILHPSEWQGIWITAPREGDGTESAPMFRKTFLLRSTLASARLYLSGLGLYEVKINGAFADDTVLNPAHTQYEDTVHYRVFDLSTLLTSGSNVLTVELGDGFYHNDVGVWNWQNAVWRDRPKLRAMLYLTYADGTEDTIVTDESWRVKTDGPILSNNILLGDRYDARREEGGWLNADFDDSHWAFATAAAEPQGKLVFGEMEPMRRLQSFVPEVSRLSDGTYLIKAPVMTTGWVKLCLDAPEGETITVTYGEQLQKDGYLKKPTDFGIAFQIDHYTAKGVKGECYEPKFSYKGYRYVQVENYSGSLTPEDVTCYFIANDVASSATLETGNALINRLHLAMRRTVHNNLQGKPTDTPVWEKNGWTGDFHVSLESICFNYAILPFTLKFLKDLEDAADERGVVPVIAPTANWGLGNQVVWNGVLINAVYEMLCFYGSRSTVERFWQAMTRQVAAYLCELEKRDLIWQNDQLADWVAPFGGMDPDAPTAACPSEGSSICGTGYVYLILSRMAEMASLLDKQEEAAFYKKSAERLYTAFHNAFYNAEKGIYESAFWDGSSSRSRYRQTSNLVPLAFGLCPEEHRGRVIENLVRDIAAKNNHLDTGMVGTKLLLPILSEAGHHELAVDILTNTTYPSWGYWIEQGSDTTWEGFENTARSHNHYFLGTYDEWLFRYLAGVHDMTDGFKTVTLFPRITPRVGYVRCHLQTVRGELVSDWELQKDSSLLIRLRIPIGTTARVILPCRDASFLKTQGALFSPDAYAFENNRLALTLESGNYRFLITPEGVVTG
ncbi:MAG: family 78 glycoside hydrolase catalytic domain [Clostridia bacterium]|nr:family 78 glycoside hydrolase catalytic domain [Clostridia bacterium]